MHIWRRLPRRHGPNKHTQRAGLCSGNPTVNDNEDNDLKTQHSQPRPRSVLTFTVYFVMEPQAANLCERCQLLAFDERKAGCSVTVSKKGDECLIMPERWRKDEDQREMWELPVDWDAPVELVDSLPSLPALEAAAQSGCEFCGFIRGEILSRDTDERSGKVEVALRRLFRQQVRCVIQMSWVWCARNVQDGVYGDSAGYLYLSVKVTEVRDDGSPCESATLGLLAEATEREFFACHTRYRNSQLLC